MATEHHCRSVSIQSHNCVHEVRGDLSNSRWHSSSGLLYPHICSVEVVALQVALRWCTKYVKKGVKPHGRIQGIPLCCCCLCWQLFLYKHTSTFVILDREINTVECLCAEEQYHLGSCVVQGYCCTFLFFI